jgi:hypothetical protein
VAEATRPLKPDQRPKFFPGTPCELQQPPDLHAAKGGPDETLTSTGVVIPPLKKSAAASKSKAAPANTRDAWAKAAAPTNPETFAINLLKSYFRRTNAGLVTPDPMNFGPKDYLGVLARIGLTLDKSGNIVARPGGKLTSKPAAAASKTEKTRSPR